MSNSHSRLHSHKYDTSAALSDTGGDEAHAAPADASLDAQTCARGGLAGNVTATASDVCVGVGVRVGVGDVVSVAE